MHQSDAKLTWCNHHEKLLFRGYRIVEHYHGFVLRNIRCMHAFESSRATVIVVAPEGIVIKVATGVSRNTMKSENIKTHVNGSMSKLLIVQ